MLPQGENTINCGRALFTTLFGARARLCAHGGMDAGAGHSAMHDSLCRHVLFAVSKHSPQSFRMRCESP
jgi:hypothetical protein